MEKGQEGLAVFDLLKIVRWKSLFEEPGLLHTLGVRQEAFVQRLELLKVIILLFGMFVGSAYLQAQSSVNIGTGSFLEAAGSFGVGDAVVFQFTAPNVSGIPPYVFSGTGGDHSGFQSCTQAGCTVATIVQIGKSVPLQLTPPGGLFGFGGSPAYCWNGGGMFTYKSGFSYQIKSGVLTAQGVVTPSMSFTPADPTTCTPNGLPAFVATGQWRYVAKFTRQNGMYYLTQVQFDPLP